MLTLLGITRNSGHHIGAILEDYIHRFGFGIQSVTISGGTPTGISNVEASASAKSSTLYNLAGQQVSESYKGIVVKNGKKYLNK